MTEALFIADLDAPKPGDLVSVTEEEGRHAVTVRRIRPGETVLVSDGIGHAVRGPVMTADKNGLVVEVADVISLPEPAVRYVAVQALAKGDRADLAIEMLTELGVDEIVPWQASRSVVKWAPERIDRALTRWRKIAREATKQSRRFRVPVVSFPLTTSELALRIPDVDLALILHETAEQPLASLDLPISGVVLMVIGPEGGLTEEEVATFTAAGGHPVVISKGVLRTSTAGVVALAQLRALAPHG